MAVSVPRMERVREIRGQPVPTVNPRRLTGDVESVDTFPDEGYLRVGLVCPDRSIPVAGCGTESTRPSALTSPGTGALP